MIRRDRTRSFTPRSSCIDFFYYHRPVIGDKESEGLMGVIVVRILIMLLLILIVLFSFCSIKSKNISNLSIIDEIINFGLKTTIK